METIIGMVTIQRMLTIPGMVTVLWMDGDHSRTMDLARGVIVLWMVTALRILTILSDDDFQRDGNLPSDVDHARN